MGIEDDVTRMLRERGFEASLSALTEDAFDLHIRAFSEGLASALIGRTITDARGDVWDGDGHWSIELLLDDGSSLDVPGHCFAHGPLADIVRMAGGAPDGHPGETDWTYRGFNRGEE